MIGMVNNEPDMTIYGNRDRTCDIAVTGKFINNNLVGL